MIRDTRSREHDIIVFLESNLGLGSLDLGILDSFQLQLTRPVLYTNRPCSFHGEAARAGLNSECSPGVSRERIPPVTRPGFARNPAELTIHLLAAELCRAKSILYPAV